MSLFFIYLFYLETIKKGTCSSHLGYVIFSLFWNVNYYKCSLKIMICFRSNFCRESAICYSLAYFFALKVCILFKSINMFLEFVKRTFCTIMI